MFAEAWAGSFSLFFSIDAVCCHDWKRLLSGGDEQYISVFCRQVSLFYAVRVQ